MSFSTRAELGRHLRHKNKDKLPCQIQGCGMLISGGRKDNLQRHMRGVHKFMPLEDIHSLI